MKQPSRVPLQIDYKKFFVAIGKGFVSGVAAFAVNPLAWSGVASSGMDILASLGLKADNLEQKKYMLFLGALARALEVLLSESGKLRELQKESKIKQVDERELEKLSEKLAGVLAGNPPELNADFLNRPEGLSVWKKLESPLADWLFKLGLPINQARMLAGRLPAYVASALHDEWRSNPTEYTAIEASITNPFEKADTQAREWRAYHTSLVKQIHEPVFGESFGLRQIYIPLRAYYAGNIEYETYVYYKEAMLRGFERLDENRLELLRQKFGQEFEQIIKQKIEQQLTDFNAEQKEKKAVKIVTDLDGELHRWYQQANKDDAYRFISGDPGSGKSSCTRIFAAELAKAGKSVLFIPLHRIDPLKELEAAVGEYLGNREHFSRNPLELSERPPGRMLLIFDGLDELAGQGKQNAELARKFIEEIKRKVDTINSQTLKINVLISGRILAIEGVTDIFRKPWQVLHLLRYFVTEEEREQYSDDENLLAIDQRDMWWRKLAKIRGADYQAMPSTLDRGRLRELTAQPLLNYLVSLSYERGRLDFSKNQNLNRVFYDLLEAVYNRDWDAAEINPGTVGLSLDNFVRVLEEIGLAVFHGDGRKASLKKLEEVFNQSNLENALGEFQKNERGISQLLLSFFFRSSGIDKGEKMVEFTHKSFGEYLAARRLVRGLKTIHKQFLSFREDPDSGYSESRALEVWVKLAGPVAISIYVMDFIRDEIQADEDNKELVSKWQETLCRLIEHVLRNGTPMERFAGLTFQEMSRQSRNAEEALLVLLNACARFTGNVSPINWPEKNSLARWLSRLHSDPVGEKAPVTCLSFGMLSISKQNLSFQNLIRYDLAGSVFSENMLANINLSRAILNGVSFKGAKLLNANFSRAKLQEANLSNASLGAVNFNEADITGAHLEGALLEGANFVGARLEKACLMRAHLEHSNLKRANLEEANLEEASLVSADVREAILDQAILKNATLRDVNFEEANLKEVNFENANLSGANFKNADISGANLKGTTLKGANLSGTRFAGVDFKDVNLERARIGIKWKNTLSGYQGEPDWVS